MMKSTTRVTVRAEINADGTGRIGSIFGELDAEIPPTPELIAERIALLKICDVGAKLNGIGRTEEEREAIAKFLRKKSRSVKIKLLSEIGEAKL